MGVSVLAISSLVFWVLVSLVPTSYFLKFLKRFNLAPRQRAVYGLAFLTVTSISLYYFSGGYLPPASRLFGW